MDGGAMQQQRNRPPHTDSERVVCLRLDPTSPGRRRMVDHRPDVVLRDLHAAQGPGVTGDLLAGL